MQDVRQRLFNTLLLFVIGISFTSGEEHCVKIDIYNVCVNVVMQQDCQIEITETIDDLEMFNKVVPIQHMGSDSFCGTIQAPTQTDCEFCQYWDLTLENNGTATGRLSIQYCDSEERIELGTFTDPRLVTCAVPCPNDCSGNGVCQYSGQCNCAEGYYGPDCNSTENCYYLTQTITRMVNTRDFQYQLLPGENWIGYVSGYQPLAQIEVSIEPVNNSMIDFYSYKSCYPIPAESLYNSRIINITDETHTWINEDCSNIAGGLWYLLVQCSNGSDPNVGCGFNITASWERVKQIDTGVSSNLTIYAQHQYATFNVTQSTFMTVEISTVAHSEDITTVEILPNLCPSDAFAFGRLSVPSLEFDGVLKYVFTFAQPQIAPWFIRMTVANSMVIPLNYTIAASYAKCTETCRHGFCNFDDSCSCDSGWSGQTCSDPIIVTHPESNDTPTPPAPTPTPNSKFSGSWLFLVSVSAGALIILLVVVATVVFFVRRSRQNKKPHADTLFSMLAHEQTLDDL